MKRTHYSVVIANKNMTEGAGIVSQVLNLGLDVVEIVNSGTRLIETCETYRPDLIVSDIDLLRLDALLAYEQIVKNGLSSKVILIGESIPSDYLLKCYEMGIADCFLRPYTKERFKAAIKRALKLIDCESSSDTVETDTSHVIRITHNRRQLHIKEEQIIFVEKLNDVKKARIYLVNGQAIDANMSLKRIQEQMKQTFFCPHRSFIINLKHVKAVRADTMTPGNHIISMMYCENEVQLSRLKYDQFIRCWYGNK